VIDPRERHLVRYLGGFSPFVVARAEGIWLETTDGRRLLDFSSGQICSTLGHRHPRVMAAIRDALDTVVHLDSRMLSEPLLALAQRLADLAPGELTRVIALSTGAEANELALKLAKLHTGGFEVVGVARSFHGATFGAASSTYLRSRRGFGPLVPGTLAVPAPYAYRCPIRHCDGACDLSCLDAGFELADQQSVGAPAAFICEPVLSSGGVIVPPQGWLERAAEHCRARGLLLVVDEAQTGLGRCGYAFASDRDGVVPDLLTLSKTLGGGIPLSAVVTTDEIEAGAVARGLAHNTSHVGDPLPAAAGVAGIDVIAEEGLVARAAATGAHLRLRLDELAERHACIGDVRSLGLLAGLELVHDRGTREPALGLAARVADEAVALGLSLHPIPTGPSAHCFRIAPPLNATLDEVDRAVELLDAALTRACGPPRPRPTP
jgi:2,2-dialkylglycine decarboxylase (pyruvate)